MGNWPKSRLADFDLPQYSAQLPQNDLGHYGHFRPKGLPTPWWQDTPPAPPRTLHIYVEDLVT